MIAYKIVFRNSQNKLMSYVSNQYHSIEYKPNTWTRPLIKNSLLYVFETLQDAWSYLEKNKDLAEYEQYELYRCEVDELEDVKILSPWDFDYVKDFWGKIPGNYGYQTIKGTRGTKRLRLIERVRIAYKLCSTCENTGKLLSFNDPYGTYSVKYKVGEWTYPKLQNSLLFVFDTLENAKAYAKDFPNFPLYECEVGEVFKPTSPTSYSSTYIIEKLWRGEANSSDLLDIRGSYGTNRIKLLRKIN